MIEKILLLILGIVVGVIFGISITLNVLKKKINEECAACQQHAFVRMTNFPL